MLVRGPFSIAWGESPIIDVSEVAFNYDVATNDYETADGRTYTVEGAITASVALTLLASDVEALAAVLPQYYVAKGGTLSTGETVTADAGAIDVVAAQCDTAETKAPLDVTSCNGEMVRLVNARPTLTAVNLDNNALRTVEITFRGEPETIDGKPTAALQFWAGVSES